MECAHATSTPGLLELNAPLIEEQIEHRGLIDLPNAQLVAERVLSAATALVAVSDEVAEHFESFAAATGKISVVPNGVNPDRYPPDLKPSLPAPPGTFTVGFVGSMKPWHGVAKLLEAFSRLHARFPETRLLLVGDGPGREQLVAEAASRGVDKVVQFTGAVSPCDVPGLLASMDVAVAPYPALANFYFRSEEHTSELQSRSDLVCRLLLEKKKTSISKTELRSYLSFRSAIRELIMNVPIMIFFNRTT